MNIFSTALKMVSKFPKRNALGFTMIELLVVIAVIGVLAVAVLSSINPIEQINKGRDTRTRSDAAQLINAVDRFFAIHEVYPWNLESEDGSYIPASVEYAYPFEHAPGDDFGWLNRLVSTAEVKEGFTNRLRNDDIYYVTKGEGTNRTMYVCFEPTSQAFKLDAERNCADGTTPEDLEIDGRAACVEEGENLICLP